MRELPDERFLSSEEVMIQGDVEYHRVSLIFRTRFAIANTESNIRYRRWRERIKKSIWWKR